MIWVRTCERMALLNFHQKIKSKLTLLKMRFNLCVMITLEEILHQKQYLL